MSEPIGHSVWSGTVKLPGLEMKVHVLNTGVRVVEEDSVNAFIDWLESGPINVTPEIVAPLAAFMQGRGPVKVVDP